VPEQKLSGMEVMVKFKEFEQNNAEGSLDGG